MYFISANRRDEVLKLDISGGRVGVLQQIVPVVCSPTGQPKARRLSYLNAAVRALCQIQIKENVAIASPVHVPLKEADAPIRNVGSPQNSAPHSGEGVSQCHNDKSNYDDTNLEAYSPLLDVITHSDNFISNEHIKKSSNQIDVQKVNQLNEKSSRLESTGNADDKYITPKKDKMGNISCIATPTNEYILVSSSNSVNRSSKCTQHAGDAPAAIISSPVTADASSKGIPQKKNSINDGLDFREDSAEIREYFCM